MIKYSISANNFMQFVQILNNAEYLYKNINKMFAAVLTSLQALAFTATVGSTITKEVVYSQIKEVVAKHQKELATMSAIYQLCEKLYFQEALLDQLKTAHLYTFNQWELLGRNINLEITAVNKFFKQFSDVLVKAQGGIKKDWANYFVITIYTLGAMKKSWEVYRKINPLPEAKPTVPMTGQEIIANNSKNFRASVSTSDSITQTDASSRSSVIVQVQANVPVKTNLTRSKFQALKDWGTKAKNFLAQHGVRILFLAFAIYNLAKGGMQITDLMTILRETREYFAESGGFKQKEEKVAQSLLVITSNIYSLANISYTAILELHSLYLTRCAVQPINSSIYFTKAAEMVPQRVGVSPQFIKNCSDFLVDLQASNKSGKNIADKLQDFMNIYTKYLKDGVISQTFIKILTYFSKSVAADSIVSQALHDKQRNLTNLLTIVQSQFTSLRGANFDKLQITKKTQIDKTILSDTEAAYKEIMLQDANSALNSLDKTTIMYIICNFCEKFYGTDSTGATVYGHSIAEGRQKQKFSDLFNNVSTKKEEGIIPIKLLDQAAETQERSKMVNLLKEVNKQKKVIPSTGLVTPNHILFRYSRIIIRESKKDEKGATISEVVGVQGAKFKINEVVYVLQQELLSKTSTLVVEPKTI